MVFADHLAGRFYECKQYLEALWSKLHDFAFTQQQALCSV
jgi:hypothetical protein